MVLMSYSKDLSRKNRTDGHCLGTAQSTAPVTSSRNSMSPGGVGRQNGLGDLGTFEEAMYG